MKRREFETMSSKGVSVARKFVASVSACVFAIGLTFPTIALAEEPAEATPLTSTIQLVNGQTTDLMELEEGESVNYEFTLSSVSYVAFTITQAGSLPSGTSLTATLADAAGTTNSTWEIRSYQNDEDYGYFALNPGEWTLTLTAEQSYVHSIIVKFLSTVAPAFSAETEPNSGSDVGSYDPISIGDIVAGSIFNPQAVQSFPASDYDCYRLTLESGQYVDVELTFSQVQLFSVSDMSTTPHTTIVDQDSDSTEHDGITTILHCGYLEPGDYRIRIAYGSGFEGGNPYVLRVVEGAPIEPDDPSTDPDDPSTEPDDPSTDPDEPSTNPDDRPSTDPDESIEGGTSLGTAPTVKFDTTYRGGWTRDTDHLGLHAKVVVPSTGGLTFQMTKPIDSKGERGRVDLVLYSENGEAVWGHDTKDAAIDASSSYRYTVNVAPGTYVMRVTPSFIVNSGLIDFTYSFSFEADAYCETEPNGTTERADFLEFGHMYSGTYASNKTDDRINDELDFFCFNGTQGESYRIVIQNFDALDATTWLCHMYAPDGTSDTIHYDFDSIDSQGRKYYEFTAPASGKYYIEFENVSNHEPISYEIGVFEVGSLATAIELSPSTLSLQVGDSSRITAEVQPESAEGSVVVWSSSNNSVASVDSSGTVTAQSAGNAIITAKVDGTNVSGTCIVTVSDDTAVPSIDFPDLNENEWYMKDGWVPFVVQQGLMSGYAAGPDAGKFGPYDSILRGQVVTILYRHALGKTAETTDNNVYTGFPDVERGSYCAAAVKWAKETGIVTGYDAGEYVGTFRPDAPVTRQELATMIARYAGWSQGLGVPGSPLIPSASTDALFELEDWWQCDTWALYALAWCADNGVLTGIEQPDGTTTLSPQDTAWRASMAKMITVVIRDLGL